MTPGPARPTASGGEGKEVGHPSFTQATVADEELGQLSLPHTLKVSSLGPLPP